MVSMVETSHPDQNDMVMDPIVPKTEPMLDGSISSTVSTPDPEVEALTQDPAQTQKRKGGRKPVRNIFASDAIIRGPAFPVIFFSFYLFIPTSYHVFCLVDLTPGSFIPFWLLYISCLVINRAFQIYATSEERKQRNRQAQAAFRERRTEYIRQLETTIKRNEESLQSLQQSHRSAADECLMLRYKNSLLERILLEKGMYLLASDAYHPRFRAHPGLFQVLMCKLSCGSRLGPQVPSQRPLLCHLSHRVPQGLDPRRGTLASRPSLMHLPCRSVRARMVCRRHSSRLRQRLMCHHRRMPSHQALASRLACPPLTSKGQDVRSCYLNRGLSTARPHHRLLVCRSRIRMSLSSGCRVVSSELQLTITHLLSRNIMIS